MIKIGDKNVQRVPTAPTPRIKLFVIKNNKNNLSGINKTKTNRWLTVIDLEEQ